MYNCGVRRFINGIFTFSIFVIIVCQACCGMTSNGLFTDTWAAHIVGGEKVARALAEKHGFTYIGKIMPDYYHLRHQRISKRSIYPSSRHLESFASETQVRWVEQQVARRRVKRGSFNDPKWPRMWYLNRADSFDMNIMRAWALGYTGKNVVVTILDDGIEKNHPDLVKNYDPGASYDVNSQDPDPQPRYDAQNENRHGTRCAGEVAAEANNRICSVGVAFDARIGGVRMLDGDVTDAVEAQSLGLNNQYIDVYSASWGPDDDGKTVEDPNMLAKQAFLHGVTEGRGGLGSIFVWASGNGGNFGDNCNCDGYTNSIHTLSISSATESGDVPWYSEACSSTLATTYSSGAPGQKQIVTTDLGKGCTESHTGTSASAPLAAGICALALEANPQLTWRDMQHIVMLTSRAEKLKADDWVINGVGRRVSHSFGYGLMDAAAMVIMARNWTSVPQQRRCVLPVQDVYRRIPISGRASVSVESDGCAGTPNELRYLEHVQAIVTLRSTRRGEVEVFLTSPSGTRSTLLAPRRLDTSMEGFKNWAFMTTHVWGESPHGKWTLEVKNSLTASSLESLTIVFHGTTALPYSVRKYRSPPNIPDTPASLSSGDCTAEEYYLNGACYKVCPSGYYESSLPTASHLPLPAVRPLNPTSRVRSRRLATSPICLRCHVSCSACYGSQSSACLACVHDSRWDNDSGTCVPRGLIAAAETSAQQQGSQNGAYSVQGVLLAVLPIVACVFIGIACLAAFFSLQSRRSRTEKSIGQKPGPARNSIVEDKGRYKASGRPKDVPSSDLLPEIVFEAASHGLNTMPSSKNFSHHQQFYQPYYRSHHYSSTPHSLYYHQYQLHPYLGNGGLLDADDALFSQEQRLSLQRNYVSEDSDVEECSSAAILKL